MDSILAAQSFHWFYNNPKAIEEIFRVLKPKAVFGLIWYAPDRSVPWIRNIEAILDKKFNALKIINTYDDKVFTPLRDHPGFVNEGSDLTSFTQSQEFNFTNVLERYKGKSVIASAPEAEQESMMQKIEQELKVYLSKENSRKYVYQYVMKLHWFQKAYEVLKNRPIA